MKSNSKAVDDFKHTTSFLAALGDPIRLQIIRFLGQKGQSNVKDIAEQFDLSRPAISHHLKILKMAAAVDSRKAGQEVYYWLQREHVVSTLQQIAEDTSQMRNGQ
ncbi:winged helix-turn-helix transcriptional regulator [Bacillaceae bacterium SIJ1]|uniref:ArsR/SmtB family transcription factor n=1 Tax=Litoribacterium kuwaitense TaxID=1398745 RepID=UPI0013EBA94E|nr:metalloregulator ArsR/SmtB family transcription factor [Litoribacterium kuwaitense]NGP45606.1 winged helix-turn-helix transcriptional regulator [Litoribacterium kuwaitense]